MSQRPLGRVLSILGSLRDLPKYYKDVKSIARRMFVTNAFDGLLAALGVSVGGYASTFNPSLLAMSIIGGGVAMGLFSGVVGVYISERAERLRELRELERSMAKSLDGTIYSKLARVIPVYVALWSGLGAVSFPVVVAAPYFLAAAGVLLGSHAFYASIGIGLGLAAALGYYLGSISGESRILSTLRLLLLALGGIVIVYVLKVIAGIPD